jgi:type I restriction enzyme S subunit
LSYSLCSDDFVNEVNNKSIGISYPAISDDKLMSIKIALPKSLDKQNEIFANLTNSTREIDTLISNIQQQIKLLEELRTSLVSDVVTGKIDVRGVAVPEFETVEEAVDREDDITETEEDEQ